MAAVVALLLEANADPNLVNARKATAYDIGVEVGGATSEVCKLLGPVSTSRADTAAAAVAGAAADPSGFPVCAVCGERVRNYNLSRIKHRVERGDERNPYVVAFAGSAAFAGLIAQSKYHRCYTTKALRKEVSESWSVLAAVREVMSAAGLGADERVCIVDLCAGKSLTTALLELELPAALVVAVDVITELMTPHFSGRARYLRADVFDSGFTVRLRRALAQITADNPSSSSGAEAPVPVIVCGMHLCGALSARAVDLLGELPQAVGIVLSPCCMPSKKLMDVGAITGTRVTAEQYLGWCKILAE
jgi:hypothetical protein